MINPEIIEETEQRRLAWRCRRGLLELDILLQRFSENYLKGLSNLELFAFNSLLDLPDNVFLDLVSSRVNIASIQELNSTQLDGVAIQTLLLKLNGN